MEINYLATILFSALSLISCILLFILSLTSSFLRKSYPFYLVFILTTIEIPLFACFIIPIDIIKAYKGCIVQGICLEIFSLMNILWIWYMSFEMYNVVINSRPKMRFGTFWPLLIMLTFSILLSLIILYLDYYGEAGLWCWIREKKSNKLESILMTLIMFYGILWIIIVWNIFTAIRVAKKLNTKLCGKNKFVVYKIILYPIGLVLVYIPLTVLRLIDGYVEVPVGFANFAESFSLLEGFLNVLIFGITNDVKSVILKLFRKKSYKMQYTDMNITRTLDSII